MKSVNFNITVAHLTGRELKDDGGEVLLKKIVGNLMVQMKAKRDALRQYDIASKIYSSEGELQLEDADFELVKSCVEESGISLVESAILRCMEQKDKKK